MHGTNQSRPMERGDGSILQVHKIWYTLQGEGPFSGCPAVFIRLTGCNLRCHFCDTNWNDSDDERISVDEVVENVLRESGGRTNLVVLTGGEPLRQPLSPLCQLLNVAGYLAQVETAGTYWQDLPDNVIYVVSPKTKHIHRRYYTECKHWKYVIRTGEVSDADGLPSRTTQIIDPKKVMDVPVTDIKDFANQLNVYGDLDIRYGAPARPPSENDDVTVWLSPCNEGDSTFAEQKATYDNIKLVGQLALQWGYRAQLQIHNIFGVE